MAVTTIAISAPIAISAAVRANGNSDAARSRTGADEDADEGAEPVAALPAVRSVPILMSLLDARGAHGSTFRPELGTQERRQERTPGTSSPDWQRRLAGRRKHSITRHKIPVTETGGEVRAAGRASRATTLRGRFPCCPRPWLGAHRCAAPRLAGAAQCCRGGRARSGRARQFRRRSRSCLLYTSDAADEEDSVD